MRVHSYHTKLLSTLFGCALLLFLSGCDNGPQIGNLNGTVTFEGKPISEGFVLMSSEETGVHISSDIRSDGTYQAHTAEGPGVPPGLYALAVLPPSMPIPDTIAPGPIVQKRYPMIPTRYRSPESSGLTVTVKAGENSSTDIDMKP